MEAKSPLDRCVAILKDSKRLVVSTGAGMSKESGIPTFRDAPSSLWANYDPETLATPEGFLADPPLVWRWYSERRQMIGEVKPHPGHYAIAEMEPMFERFTLLTQNIDDLHRRAGSKELIEVHGNIFKFKCFDNHHAIESLPDNDQIPPRCHCGSMLRPDVVWFGEMLPEGALNESFTSLAMCDTILVVGTSGMVHPAAGFPSYAKSHGARVIEINPEETAITADADIFVQGPAGKVLPDVLNKLKRVKS